MAETSLLARLRAGTTWPSLAALAATACSGAPAPSATSEPSAPSVTPAPPTVPASVPPADATSPASTRASTRIVSVALGQWTRCAIADDGSTWCWGDGLGASPVVVPELGDAVEIGAASRARLCVRTRGGDVRCLVTRDAGRPTVEAARFAFPARRLAGACARLEDGSVACRADTDDAPRVVDDLRAATLVTADDDNQCALVARGRLVCRNGGGVALDAHVGEVADLASTFAREGCLRLRDGAVSCWGRQDGDRPPTTMATPTLGPRRVRGAPLATALAVSGAHACAVAQGGRVACWHGLPGGRPAFVAGIEEAVHVAVHGEEACAVLRSGDVTCWTAGQTGRGDAGGGPTRIRFGL